MLPDGTFQEQIYLCYSEEYGCIVNHILKGDLATCASEKTEEMESENKLGSMVLRFWNVIVRLGQDIGGEMDRSSSTTQ